MKPAGPASRIQSSLERRRFVAILLPADEAIQ